MNYLERHEKAELRKSSEFNKLKENIKSAKLKL